MRFVRWKRDGLRNFGEYSEMFLNIRVQIDLVRVYP